VSQETRLIGDGQVPELGRGDVEWDAFAHRTPPSSDNGAHNPTLAGILVSMRRITGAAGAALVVLGFLAFMSAGSMEQVPSWWVPLPVLVIAVGFGLMWEAQIAWPRDGSAYPWRRRLAGLLVALAAFASAVATRVLLSTSLPHHWVAESIAQGVGVLVGLLAHRRLRDAVDQRLGRSGSDHTPTA